MVAIPGYRPDGDPLWADVAIYCPFDDTGTGAEQGRVNLGYAGGAAVLDPTSGPTTFDAAIPGSQTGQIDLARCCESSGTTEIDFPLLPAAIGQNDDFCIELKLSGNFGSNSVYFATNRRGTGNVGYQNFYTTTDQTEAGIASNAASGSLTFFANDPITSLPANTRTWMAVTRENGVYRHFINGQIVTSTALAYNLEYQVNVAGRGLRFGNGFFGFSGIISEYRATIGHARYTSNFTPQSQPFAFALPASDPGPPTPLNMQPSERVFMGNAPKAPVIY